MESQCYVKILYNFCTIAMAANQQCSYVALLHEFMVCMNHINQIRFI